MFYFLLLFFFFSWNPAIGCFNNFFFFLKNNMFTGRSMFILARWCVCALFFLLTSVKIVFITLTLKHATWQLKMTLNGIIMLKKKWNARSKNKRKNKMHYVRQVYEVLWRCSLSSVQILNGNWPPEWLKWEKYSFLFFYFSSFV